MPDLSLRIISVVVADQIRLRIYRGDEPVGAWPLRRRQALVLAAQLINHAMLTEGRARDELGPCSGEG
jgi:hypothetical protein